MTPRQQIAPALESVCVSLALERTTDPDALSAGERSALENYGLECFRLGMEFEKENDERDSQRPTKPVPAPEGD